MELSLVSLEKTCANPYCSKRFESSDPRKRYCCRECQVHGARSSERASLTTFRAIDGEGMGEDSEHRYVLLGVGQDQLWHEDASELSWPEIFSFLYAHYEPRVAFVGFYLGYDFTYWVKNLPEAKARSLITDEGREKRRIRWTTGPKRARKSRTDPGSYPVDLSSWQIDGLWPRTLKIRPRICDCDFSHFKAKCPHPKPPWMVICDVGPFFQKKFMDVIDPKNWNDPPVPPDIYAKILRGKERRSVAVLDEEMREYNRLENWALEQVLPQLDSGFRHIGVKLSKGQWYGPGQVAQTWLRGRAPGHDLLWEKVPKWFLDAARKSYFGGWFEIMIHGIIPGISYEYDINNAYPFIESTLPCLLHGKYTRGTGKPPKLNDGDICLVHAKVKSPETGKSRYAYIGTMLHRTPEGRICRPMRTQGWFWWHELEAAVRAKLVSPNVEWFEWMRYEPCDCLPPLRELKFLYQMRLDVGKKSPIGIGAKLAANSSYGKLAQSVGEPQFANPIYASLITAGCRSMICDAIATHPGGKKDVAMVATDGVYFLHKHPSLPISDRLGEWDYSERPNLTLFRPGFYWDDDTRRAFMDGRDVRFKARGINAADFGSQLEAVDKRFSEWQRCPRVSPSDIANIHQSDRWPEVEFHPSFSMVSALTALHRNNWLLAGKVSSRETVVLSARPTDKRQSRKDNIRPKDRIFRTEPIDFERVDFWSLEVEEDKNRLVSSPYEKRFGMEDPFSKISKEAPGITPDGILGDIYSWAVQGE